MNTVAMSYHLAQKIGIPAEIAADGRCYITLNNVRTEWDVFGTGLVHEGQRNWTLGQWASRHGLPTDPQACAIATGYIE